MIKDGLIEAQVSFVSKDEIDLKSKSKPLLLMNLRLEWSRTETIISDWESVPSFDGPGWYGDVVFDI